MTRDFQKVHVSHEPCFEFSSSSYRPLVLLDGPCFERKAID